MGDLAHGRVPVAELCEVGRARSGVTYPAGTLLVALSATNETVGQLGEPSEVEGRYAVLVPRDPSWAPYLKVVLDRAFPRWLAAHRTGINLKEAELSTLSVEWHEDGGTRREVCEACARLDALAYAEGETVRRLKDLKSFLLVRMFC